MVKTEGDLVEIFEDTERRQIFTQSIVKYNLFMGQLDIHLLTQTLDDSIANNAQAAAATSFIENSAKWTIQQLVPKLINLKYEISLPDLKSLIQLPFMHLEHLLARARLP